MHFKTINSRFVIVYNDDIDLLRLLCWINYYISQLKICYYLTYHSPRGSPKLCCYSFNINIKQETIPHVSYFYILWFEIYLKLTGQHDIRQCVNDNYNNP